LSILTGHVRLSSETTFRWFVKVETVCAMFPNIPPAAIQFDLQKTGSVEVTCDNILRDGGLPLVNLCRRGGCWRLHLILTQFHLKQPPPTVPNIPSTSNV